MCTPAVPDYDAVVAGEQLVVVIIILEVVVVNVERIVLLERGPTVQEALA